MLEIECLDRPANEVIRPYSLLHVLSIVFVDYLHLIIICFETSWREDECEHSLGFLKLDRKIFLKFFNSKSLWIFFCCSFLLFFRFCFRFYLRFATWHELWSVLHIRAAALHFRFILNSYISTYELRELFIFDYPFYPASRAN